MKVWVFQITRAYRDTLGCFSISKVVIIYDFILFFKNIFNDNQVLLDILQVLIKVLRECVAGWEGSNYVCIMLSYIHIYTYL